MMPLAFSDLRDRTLKEVRVKITEGADSVTFITLGGSHFSLYHEQVAKERVYLEDIVGNLSNLINAPIIMTRRRQKENCTNASLTWSFFELQTVKGCVTLKWCSAGDGHPFDDVHLYKIPAIQTL